jgi:hypothetical protein
MKKEFYYDGKYEIILKCTEILYYILKNKKSLLLQITKEKIL